MNRRAGQCAETDATSLGKALSKRLGGGAEVENIIELADENILMKKFTYMQMIIQDPHKQYTSMTMTK